MKELFLTFALIIVNNCLFSQVQFEWGRQINSNSEANINSLTTDSTGFIYATGYFDGEAIFNEDTLKSNGERDLFVAKYSKDGNIMWTVQIGGSEWDMGQSVTTDTSNNVIVTGTFSRSIYFENDTLVSNGSGDILVAKYSKSGVLLWAKSVGGCFQDMGYSVKTDSVNNIYVTGSFQGYLPTFGISAQNCSDIFIMKLNPQGDFIWFKDIKGTGCDDSYSVELDIDENIYITGNIKGTTSFGNDTITSHVGSDIFLAKFNPEGECLNVSQIIGTSTFNKSNKVAISNDSCIYIIGEFMETISIDDKELTSNGATDILIAKFNWANEVVWIKRIGDEYWNFGNSLAISENNNVYVIGKYGPASSLAYFSKHDKNGTTLWNKEIYSSVEGEAITVGSDNKVYLSGYFSHSCIINYDTLRANSTFNPFIIKARDILSSIETTNDPEFSFHLYPNPTASRIYIELGQESLKEIKIYNNRGQIMLSKSFTGHVKKEQIDISSLKTGIYYIKVRTSKYVKTNKIIKY